MTSSIPTVRRLVGGGLLSVMLMVLSLVRVSAARADNIWDGGSTGPGDDFWSTTNNWDNDAVPVFPSALTFAGSTRLTPSNDLGAVTVTNITFAAGAGAFALGGDPITLGGNVSIAIAAGVATNDQTINLPLTLSTNPVLSAALAGGSTTVGKGVLVVNGAISGPFGLTSSGKNYVQLNGVNTYSGDTVISSSSGDGSFSIGNANAFGSGKVIVGATPGASQIWLQSAGNLTVTNTVEVRTQRFISAGYTVAGKTAGNLNLSGNVVLNQGSSGQDFWCQKPLTLSGTVSGGGMNGLRMASGTLILQGNNTFTNHLHSSYLQSVPTININADAAMGHTNNGVRAVFNMNVQTAAGSSPVLAPTRTFIVSPGRTLNFDMLAGSSLTVPGPISGSAISKSGPGALFLTGVNAHSNGTTISAGLLSAGTSAALGAATGSLNFSGSGTFQPGSTPFVLAAERTVNLTNAGTYAATFDVPTNFTLTAAGLIKGNTTTNSALTKTGNGKLILTGGSAGTALAGMNVQGGTLSLQDGIWYTAPAQTADGTVFNVTGGATYEQTGGTNYLPIYSCISQQYVGGAYTNLTSTGLLSGGTLVGMELMVGRRNSAVMTISGNAVLDLYSFKLGELPGYTTTCNLDGGTIACAYIASRCTNALEATSILNLNGGTIRVKGPYNVIGGYGSGTVSHLTHVNVKGGGAIIDTQTYAVGLPQSLNHHPDLGDALDGGLTKRGSGTLTLTAHNTYNGATRIEAGTLKLDGQFVLPVETSVLVSSNAVFNVNDLFQVISGLGGSGTVISNKMLIVLQEVAPGGTNAVGTLTLAAPPSSWGGTFLVDVTTNGACDRVHVQGDLYLTNFNLAVADTAALNKRQRYVIATYSGALTGPFLSAPLPDRWHVKYDTSARQVFLSYDFGTLLTLR